MLFNSFAFALFFPAVLIIYWFLPRRPQNIFLLLASYSFYGFWDWRVLVLLGVSTAVDYFVALRLGALNSAADDAAVRRKKLWLAASLVVQLGLLGFFKYFNFFAASFADLLAIFGLSGERLYLNILLPAGISFYTFKTITYTVDIYRRGITPTKNFWDYALYVSFFPTLLAGPIIRAKELLPQIQKARIFGWRGFTDGLHLIFWGLFKKIFVADNLAVIVGQIFALPNPTGYDSLLGAYFFTFQIYCDFAGYTDMARGVSKCLGLDLPINFRYPYGAISPSDFWQRWHITFSTWIRDYIFTPLGGAWKSMSRAYLNLAFTMLLAGLWHGASWVFILWGGYQGALLIGHRITQPWLKSLGKPLRPWLKKPVRRAFKILVTFHLVAFGWIIFRAESVRQAWEMISSIPTRFGVVDLGRLLPLLQFAGPLIVIELIEAVLKRDDLHRVAVVPVWGKTIVYAVFAYLIVFYGASAQSFIYMQF